MNKLFDYGKMGVLALSLALLSTSCKKDTGEFPKAPSGGGTTGDFVYGSPTLPAIADADGILSATDVHNYRISTISPFERQYQYGMAAFTNTTGNFTSLTSGGSVTVDTSNLTASSALMYQSYPTTYSLSFASNVTWNVTGAGSVPAMTYTVTSAMPSWTLFSNPASNISYWKDEWIPVYPKTGGTTADSIFNATAFATIPIKDYVSNADTVIITWHDNAGFKYTRKVPATDSITVFRPNDFAGYQVYAQADLKMEINLVSYNSVIAGGKKYYFIRMGSYIKYWRTE